jgi:hypothetical protein
MYSQDHRATVILDTDEGGVKAPAIFSVYVNDIHPTDHPALTLETLQLGALHMRRDDLVAWAGAEAIATLETDAAKEWKPYEYMEAAE